MKKISKILVFSTLLLGTVACGPDSTPSTSLSTPPSVSSVGQTPNSSEQNPSTISPSSTKEEQDSSSPSVTKLEPTITFSNEKVFTYDGTGKTPTFTVTEGVKYSVRYDQNDVFYSNEAPVEKGTYAIVVTTEEDDTYKSITRWSVFSIVSPLPEATITFEGESTYLYDGKAHSPTFTVEGLTEDQYTYCYNKDEKWYSDEAPVEIGTYALVVETEETEEYRATTKHFVFSIVEVSEKLVPELVFSIENNATITKDVDPLPTVTVPDDLTNYTIDFYCDATGIAAETPIVNGETWAIRVIVTGDPIYQDGTYFRWFNYVNKPTKEVAVVTFDIETIRLHFLENTDFASLVHAPSDVTNYEIVFDSEGLGIYNATKPTPHDTHAWVMKYIIKEDDPKYEAKTYQSPWFFCDAVPTKEVAIVTFDITDDPRSSFVEGTDFTTIVHAPSDVTDFEILFDCGDVGIVDATAPTANGHGWTMKYIIKDTDPKYEAKTYISTWFNVVAAPTGEKVDAVITFDFEAGTPFTNGTDMRTHISMPTDLVHYTIVYNNEDSGLFNQESPSVSTTGWAIVVTISGDDKYNDATFNSPWFKYVEA